MTHSSSTVIKNPSWWKRRTQLERGLLCATCGSLVLCLVLAVGLTITNGRSEEEMPKMSALNTSSEAPDVKSSITETNPSDSVCLTEGCVHAASKILSDMDKETNPCDDFYQFVCGRFRKKVIPDDKTGLSSFSIIGDKLQEQLRSIVEEKVKHDEPRPMKNAKNLYKLCMNETEIERRGDTEVKEIQKRLGGWPVIEGKDWNEGSFDWKKSIYNFRKEGFGIDYFIDFSVGADYKNTTNRIIELDQASLGVNREYMIKGLSHRRVKAYYEYMVDIAVLFGANKTVAQEELKKSLEFEIKLANISLSTEDRRDANKLYNKMKLSALMEKFSFLPWQEYLSEILPKKITVSQDEEIIVAVPSFLEQLEKLINNTEKRTIANYLLWRGTASTISYLPEVYRNRQLKYSTVVTGSTQREARWKECSDMATRTVALAVGSLYVQKYFKKDAKNKAQDLVDRIREEMYKLLENVEWMDDETRKAAIEKAYAMQAHIAYPDELLNEKKLTEFYDGLEINEDGTYLEAILNTTKFGRNYNLGRLREPINKTEWISHGRPAVINAFYSPLENSIQFPAGILQGTFFSDDRPNYLNFGAIGFVIGHEITHGFDDQGRQFNKEGTLTEWWEEDTKKKYLQKAKCIIEQYGNYMDSQVKMKLNGINTQGENIADNGGIKTAYKAYKKYKNETGGEPRLPGLQEFSPEQMFWISAASTWCSTYRDETLSNRITTGYHSPGEFRVKGPMSNMVDFSRDFQCPEGSPMNPIKKCTVW